MSTLQIRKLESGSFKHVDSIDGEFFLGRFSFKQELDKSFLVEAYGAKRREYDVLQISVFDYLGTAELFTNWTDLENRLTELGYTGIETNGIIPTASYYISSDSDNSLQLGTDNKLFVPESTGDFLSNDPSTYSPATLPLTGTEVALLNDGTNWVKITWNNIKAQLKAYFDTLYQAILVSGTNIKTINGNSILGSGNLVVSGGGGDEFLMYDKYWKAASFPLLEWRSAGPSNQSFGNDAFGSYGSSVTPTDLHLYSTMDVIPSGFVIDKIDLVIIYKHPTSASSLQVYIDTAEINYSSVVDTTSTTSVIVNEVVSVPSGAYLMKFIYPLTVASNSLPTLNKKIIFKSVRELTIAHPVYLMGFQFKFKKA